MTTLMTTNDRVGIRYVDTAEKAYDIEAEVGASLMLAAKANMVRGIDGDCGGNAACGTCLIRLDASTIALLPPPGSDELELLDALGVSSQDHRLGCQVKVSPQLQACAIRVGQPV